VTLNTGDSTDHAQIGFSSDGSRLFVSGRTSVHTWEVGTFRRSGEYGPFHQIQNMARDGSRIACWANGGDGKTLEIVETLTGRIVTVLQGHRTRIVDSTFNGDGSRLATRSEDNEIRVWATDSGQALTTLQAATPEKRLPGGLWHEVIAFTRDGRRLASTSNKRITLWNVTTARRIAEWEAHTGPIQAIAFTDDGRRLLSVRESIRVWDGKTGKSLTVLSPSSNDNLLAAESPDGSFVADITWHKALHVWDRASGTLIATLNGIQSKVSALTYSPNGKYLIAANIHGQVRVWEGPTVGGLILKFARAGYLAQDLSKDGERLVVADGNEVQVLDARTGEVVDSWNHTGNGPVMAVAYHPRGDTVASGSRDGSICIWRPRSPLPQIRIQAHQSQISTLAFSPDGSQLVSGSGSEMVGSRTLDRTLRFWDTTTGQNRLIREFDFSIRSVAFSPDGRTLIACLTGGNVLMRRLDAATGSDLPLFEGVSELSRVVIYPTFSRMGEWIAAGLAWDARTGKLLQKYEQAATPAYAFTPDGTRLLGSFNDSTLNIWNTSTGERILRLYLQGVFPIQFSPDGERLYGNGFSGIRIYGTKPAIPAEADELYERINSRFPLVCEMRTFLEHDRETEPRLREIVLRMIEGKEENSETVSDW
jgi:WD40 repeat protein